MVKKNYKTLFLDIRECIDVSHKDSSIKSKVLLDKEKYIIKDKRLTPTLYHLKFGGKKLFLLTNSPSSYTNEIMNFILPGKTKDSWKRFFDVIITDANKPDFFIGNSDFIDTETGKIANGFEKDKMYSGGNYGKFEEILNLKGDEILYVGDHIYGDILRSKKHTTWRTCMIIEELTREIFLRKILSREFKEMYILNLAREKIDNKILAAYNEMGELKHITRENPRIKILEEEISYRERDLQNIYTKISLLEEKIDKTFNTFWGQLTQEYEEMSHFGREISEYACIYTSRVSNFLYYPIRKYFQAPQEVLPHDR